MSEAGFSAETIEKVYWAAGQLAAASSAPSEALRLVNLKSQVGLAWSDRSNGDEVWAIVRNRRLVTIMLRRNTQPKTPAALKVDRVTLVS
jgi:hypothetical protein